LLRSALDLIKNAAKANLSFLKKKNLSRLKLSQSAQIPREIKEDGKGAFGIVGRNNSIAHWKCDSGLKSDWKDPLAAPTSLHLRVLFPN